MLDDNSLEIILDIPEDISNHLEDQNIDGSDIDYILVFKEADLKLYKQVIESVDKYLFLKSLAENYSTLSKLFYTYNDLELFIFKYKDKEYLIGIMYH